MPCCLIARRESARGACIILSNLILCACSVDAIVHFGSVGQGAFRVFLGALKPTRRVTDSKYLDHTATQHWFDRQSPYGPVPVPTSGPPRWAGWRCDRSSSSQERIEALLHWKRLLVGSLPTCSQKLTHRPCSLRPWCSPAAHQR